MEAKSLMDSRKFCLLMDDLAGTWAKKRAPEEDKEYRLQAVLDFLGASSPVINIERIKPHPLDAMDADRMPVTEPPRPPKITLEGYMTDLMARMAQSPRDSQGRVVGLVPAQWTPMQVQEWCEANKAPLKIHADSDMTIPDRTNWQFYFA